VTLLLATGGPVESVHRPGFPVVFTSGGDPLHFGRVDGFQSARGKRDGHLLRGERCLGRQPAAAL
jgi:hypothetical protein